MIVRETTRRQYLYVPLILPSRDKTMKDFALDPQYLDRLCFMPRRMMHFDFEECRSWIRACFGELSRC